MESADKQFVRDEYMSEYCSALAKAIDSTRAVGFDVPDFAIELKSFLTMPAMERMHQRVGEYIEKNQLTVEAVGLRCAPLHLALKPVIDEALGCSTLLTLGAVQFDDDVFFMPTSMDIDALAQAGNYHVWLTLPSCEVIDLTLTSALYLKKRLKPSMAGIPLMMRPEANPKMRWSPLLVGNGVVERLLSHFM
ncbi:hypothetical protein J2A69_29455 [Burkholderia pseudomallei]|uniref:hypothetical protein n=1 Tax=Burkholderia pseudomallei TaxID=28450 RepID=UPI001A97BA13|nr:hypothetical protein [Burkholderia pseudomallei]QSY06562.1 hypothetical protein J1906_29450 [Burkholderia pseudomallei]QSY14345.1 hypothetical protein J2A69_29455 [Burkholderia pseudomallei]QTB63935.1 hypothetical protein J3D99_08840 [Burkholderia pseudomallei]